MTEPDLGYVIPSQKKTFWETHTPYFHAIFYVALAWGGINGLILWFSALIESANHNQTAWVLLQVLFVEILIPFYGFFPGLVSFIVVFLVSVLPYLVIRGLIKR